ncbi:MAG: site-specific integrase [Planctomycetota bacterium]
MAERLAGDLEKRELLIREGLADPRADRFAAAARKPLTDHAQDFLQYLRDKGSSPKHLSDREGQLGRLIAAMRATRIADLTPARVQGGIADLKTERQIAVRTANRHLMAIKAFCKWMVREGRMDSDPLVGLSGGNPNIDRRHERRALSREEIGKLIAAAVAGKDCRGLSGRDRAMLFRIALGTGFRASEIASLTPASFYLDKEQPIIVVEAGYSKNRRRAVQPIRRDLAELLKPWLATRPPDRPVFDVPNLHHRTAAYVKHDLEVAGIPYLDDGRVADFHSLRVTFISEVVASGASVKEAQLLARHADPGLTISVYTKTSLHDLGRALEAMPGTANAAQGEAGGPEVQSA